MEAARYQNYVLSSVVQLSSVYYSWNLLQYTVTVEEKSSKLLAMLY